MVHFGYRVRTLSTLALLGCHLSINVARLHQPMLHGLTALGDYMGQVYAPRWVNGRDYIPSAMSCFGPVLACKASGLAFEMPACLALSNCAGLTDGNLNFHVMAPTPNNTACIEHESRMVRKSRQC